eukprot:PhM_4_TR12967/c0_g1_i1/m.9162
MRAFAPVDYVPGANKNVGVELSGRDRFKFFKRPVVSGLSATASAGAGAGTLPKQQIGFNVTRPQVQYARNAVSAGDAGAETRPRPPPKRKLPSMITSGSAVGMSQSLIPMEGKCDAVVQTDYRENDCQTDPYSPPFEVEVGAQPEVLAIMELKYGAGLPAGQAEVDMIDRVRRRRAVEASLPQGGDDDSMKQRLEALETLEHTEWEEREAHIKQLQDDRLMKMKSALTEREEQRENATAERLARVQQDKMATMEKKVTKLQSTRHKITRKVQHDVVEKTVNKLPQRPHSEGDIIQSHVHFGKRGAPVTTNSLVDKVSTTNYDVRPTLLGFVEGLQELERTKVPIMEKVPARTMQPPPEPTLAKLSTNFQKRIERQITTDLEHAQQTIQKTRSGSPGKVRSVQELYRATPRLHRPDTPTLVLQGDDEEEREEALVLLQRLLRGRAVQNDFFEGKERCHGLIEELQAAQNAIDNESYWLQQKEFDAFRKKQEAMVDSVVQGAVGDVVFGTLDYLFKELVRQQEAAKFEALRVHAESTRKDREREELARREEQTMLRRREDEQYRMALAVHDYHALTFLQQVMGSAVVEAAEERALAEQLDMQEQQRVAPAVEDPEEVVCGLMDKVVLPSVSRRTNGTDGARSEATLEKKAKAESAFEMLSVAVQTALSGSATAQS